MLIHLVKFLKKLATAIINHLQRTLTKKMHKDNKRTAKRLKDNAEAIQNLERFKSIIKLDNAKAQVKISRELSKVQAL